MRNKLVLLVAAALDVALLLAVVGLFYQNNVLRNDLEIFEAEYSSEVDRLSNKDHELVKKYMELTGAVKTISNTCNKSVADWEGFREKMSQKVTDFCVELLKILDEMEWNRQINADILEINQLGIEHLSKKTEDLNSRVSELERK